MKLLELELSKHLSLVTINVIKAVLVFACSFFNQNFNFFCQSWQVSYIKQASLRELSATFRKLGQRAILVKKGTFLKERVPKISPPPI